MQLFIVNVVYENLKIGEGHTLAYLIPAQYDSLSETGENNNESIIVNILDTTLKPMLKYCQLSSK